MHAFSFVSSWAYLYLIATCNTGIKISGLYSFAVFKKLLFAFFNVGKTALNIGRTILVTSVSFIGILPLYDTIAVVFFNIVSTYLTPIICA